MDDVELMYDPEAAAGIILVLLVAAACITAADIAVDAIRRLRER